MTLRLRSYQQEFIDGVLAEWRKGHRRVAGVMATGGGKTPSAMSLANLSLDAGLPVLWIAHRTELIDQALDKAEQVAPGRRIGRLQGRVKQYRAQVVVGSIQTAATATTLALLKSRTWGLVVVDECFPAGTLIDGRPIESLRPGDMVRSYDEATGAVVARRVVQTMQRVPSAMVRVTLADGTRFECTPNHPILTPLGWLPAKRLHGAYVVSYAHDIAADRDALRRVSDPRDDHDESAPGYLSSSRPDLLWSGLSLDRTESALVADGLADQSEVRGREDATQQSDGARRVARKDDRDASPAPAQAAPEGREWQAGPGAPATSCRATRMADRGDDRPARWGDAVSLQRGYGAPDDDGLRRDRRSVARPALASRGRLASPESAVFTRVDRVEILESGSDGTYGGVCPDGLVYNFEVEGTHTYLIGDTGVVAHNCHHIAADSYQRVLRELRAFDEDGPLVLGVTATLDRSDGLALGATFEAVADPRIGLLDLIRHPEGPFLVPPRGIRVKIEGLDLGKVRRTAGDFNSGHLGRAMSDAMAPAKIVEAWTEHAKGRPTVAFLPTVALSIEQAEAFRDAGYRALHLDGTTPPRDREQALADFRAGEIDVLCNVGLFTEGTDLPSIACVILGRPTSSTTLYQQMVGRGLRLHPGKRDCIILDVTGVTGRHRLATLVSLGGADRPEDMPDDLLLYEDEGDESDVEQAAEEDQTEQPDADPVEYADGALAHEMIDLFGQSHSAWLRTAAGVWFLPAGHVGFLFLQRADKPERWDLCYTTLDMTHRGKLRTDMEIGYAMQAGDEFVAERPMWQTERDAPWRKLRHRSGVTKGERHDADMVAKAGALLGWGKVV